MPRPKAKVPKDELIRMKLDGYTVAQMAKHFNVSEWTICHRLDLYGYAEKKQNVQAREKLPELAKFHTMKEIAEILDVTYETVRRWTSEMGVQTKDARGAKRKEIDIELVNKLLAAGITRKNIAKRFNISVKTLYNRLPEVGNRQDQKTEEIEKKGLRCTRKVMEKCIYSSDYVCVYILIEGHRRLCLPDDCTCFRKCTIKEKRKLHEKML